MIFGTGYLRGLPYLKLPFPRNVGASLWVAPPADTKKGDAWASPSQLLIQLSVRLGLGRQADGSSSDHPPFTIVVFDPDVALGGMIGLDLLGHRPA